MYHIGIVENIISPMQKGVLSADDTVQAMVKMWDGNLLILKVHKKISSKIKVGNYVLADYSPMSPTSRYRNLYIVKVIPDKEGKMVWEKFQNELERRKNTLKQLRSISPENQTQKLKYIG